MRRSTAKNLKNNFPNITHYYPLQSNSNDVVGGLNGSDTLISYVGSGIVGNCAQFSNTTSVVTIPDDNSVSFVNKDFAMSIWVKFDSIITTPPFEKVSWVISKRDTAGGNGVNNEYNLCVSQSKEYALLFDALNSSYTYKVSSSTPSTGVWYNYIMTYKSSRKSNGLHLYRNGVLIGSTGSSGSFVSMVNGASLLLLGQPNWPPYSSLKFYGKMCEFYIFDGDISPQQAKFIYDEGVAGRDLI